MFNKFLPNEKYSYHKLELRTFEFKFEFESLVNVDDVIPLKIPEKVIDYYLNHQYNFLGNHWQSSNKSTKEINVLAFHQNQTKKVAALIDDDYKLVDWQKDVISDFSFDVKRPFYRQKSKEGVDIKNAWELGRLQHLTRLAFYAIHSNQPERFIKEFKNQTLDFIASNPVGMGVQWYCPMDIGIRVTNLLLAYDIFKQLDQSKYLCEEFDTIFLNSMYLHGQFIYNHIEYKEGLTGNHYLFNISGLLFVGTYLRGNVDVNKWYTLSMQEVEKEMMKQFFKDGGNFEGSTAYHCLSSEMMVYSTALMLRNNHPFSEHFIDRLYKTGEFVKEVLKPNNEIPQFGDNDSGRYIKLSYKETGRTENMLDYSFLMALYDGVFSDHSFGNNSDKFVEHSLIKQLANGKDFTVYYSKPTSRFSEAVPTTLKFTKEMAIDYAPIPNLINEINFYHYADFGLSIFKSPNFYLAISTISNPNMHHSWGHVHNDKLSFELSVNGQEIVTDPGSYCYTSNPELRNQFRSVKAHNTIVVEGKEQNRFLPAKKALFYLDRETRCKVLSTSQNSITLQVNYYGVIHVRTFVIHEDKVQIIDACNHPFEQHINTKLKSKGYGCL